MQSIVDYFNDRGSDVHVCALDAEKAFDCVNHYFLVYCMLLKGIPINVVNLLIARYSHIEPTVSWQGKLSKAFNMKSGILQSSLIKQKLFNIVMDSLQVKLESSNLGCRIGGCCSGVIAYAEDLILLSPTRFASQKMLDLCVSHITYCGFNFNVKRAICFMFGRTTDTCSNLSLFLYNSPLKFINSFEYLGILFLSSYGINVCLDARIREFYFAISSVLRFTYASFEKLYV